MLNFLVILIISNLFALQSLAETSDVHSPSIKKCVIALHGLARGPDSLKAISTQLSQYGYDVVLKAYPSTRERIENLSPVVGEALRDCEKRNATHIYFVTHSMGGILVRHFFQQNHPLLKNSKIKAIVMLSPPNHGSEIVDAYKNEAWFQWFNGPAGSQLGTDPTSLPNQLKPIAFDIGIIAGNVSSDPWFSHLFSEPNDGKVTVRSAKLSEMKALLVVPHGHTFIMNSKEVIDQVQHFFDHQTFAK